MTDSHARARPTWLDTLVTGGVTAAFGIAAAFVMFSAFMFYDDEGYVLISLRNFAEHGGLYRDVYTQYGPFPFVLYYAVQAIGGPLTHTVGRLITIGAWAGAALSCAALVGYVTRSLIARLAVLAAVFVYLWIMASEPTHPGGIIVFLTTLVAALGYKWIAAGRLSRWAIVVGAVTAALLLTKINIGVFLAFSACSWWLLHHRHDGLRRWAPAIVAVFGVLLPLALMRPLLGTPWVQTYALIFGCAAVGIAMAYSRAPGLVGWRELRAALLTAAGVAVVVIGVVMVRGTHARDLLEGLLLGPLRQPTSFSLLFLWAPGIRAMAVVSLVLGAVAIHLRRRNVDGVNVAVAIARLVVTVALAVTLARYPGLDPAYSVFGAALPFIWIFVWPLSGESSALSSARTWVALLFFGQCLHAFPVPGSQIAWGSVLAIPLAAMGAWDASIWLARHGAMRWLTSRAGVLAAQLAMIAFTGTLAFKFAHVAARYPEGQYLAQPGAEMIRLPDRSAALFRVLTINAAAHGDLLFSLPGMFSLNLWTGLPTPTRMNVTHWFSLLDASRQTAIAQALEANPRAVVIIDRGHIEFLAQRGLTPRGLLYDFIAKNFEPAFVIDRFEFCIRRGRKIQPFLLGDLMIHAKTAEANRAESTLLRLALLLPPSTQVSSIQLAPQNPADRPIVLDASNARVEIAPITPRGEPAGPVRQAAWPIQLSGPALVSIYYGRELHAEVARHATIILRDPTGSDVTLARLQP